MLFYNCSSVIGQVSPANLSENIDNAICEKITEITRYMRKEKECAINLDFTYSIRDVWVEEENTNECAKKYN